MALKINSVTVAGRIPGPKGDDGKSAYDTAKEGGYVGEESAFAEALADIEHKVRTFNGRDGDVVPQSGDYTADMVGAAPSTHTHTKSEISDFPTSMPASDVSVWAKAANKPTYTASEVGAAAASHGNHVPTVQTASNKVFLRNDNTWQTVTPANIGAQATITGGATTITSSNLTASRALVSDSSGKVAVSSITSTQLGYLSGVTSAIQTQLNGKADSSHKHAASDITNLATGLNIITGSYTGSDSSGSGVVKTVSLGVQAKVVIVWCNKFTYYYPNRWNLAGMATFGSPLFDDALSITSTGFTVKFTTKLFDEYALNSSQFTYNYVAFY